MIRNNYIHEAKLINNKLICDCGDDTYIGIPCRHLIAVVVKDNKYGVNVLKFQKRWEINYFQESVEASDDVLLQENQLDNQPVAEVNIIF